MPGLVIEEYKVGCFDFKKNSEFVETIYTSIHRGR